MDGVLSEEFIKNLSYTDFIALINQTNVPPGSFSTLTKWKINSEISVNSTIFEAACTTGFSLLNLIKSRQCNGVGVDISRASIEAAIKNSHAMNLQEKTKFFCRDATKFTSGKPFSHVILGAALGFFSDPGLMINNIIRNILVDGGFVLASPFYATNEFPENLIKETQKTLGISPTLKGYKEIMKHYRGMEIIFEDRCSSILESDEEIEHYCDSTINRSCVELKVTKDSIYNIMFERLKKIREVCNQIREYQNYTVLVLQIDKKTYPNRYIEIF